jgi:hypothetical protein
MATVTWVEKKGDKAAILVMSDDTRVWTPDKALADTLVGKEIPSDWTQKQGEYGPQALPPKPKGGFGGAPAAFRNTKEGQAVEQDMMNRRTALMQAVTLWTNEHGEETLIDVAQLLYVWLTDTRYVSGAVTNTSSASDKGDGAVATSSPPTSSPKQVMDGHGEEEVDGGVGVDGEDTPGPSSAVHVHEWAPAPREGWVVCECGKAEKAAKARA